MAVAVVEDGLPTGISGAGDSGALGAWGSAGALGAGVSAAAGDPPVPGAEHPVMIRTTPRPAMTPALERRDLSWSARVIRLCCAIAAPAGD